MNKLFILVSRSSKSRSRSGSPKSNRSASPTVAKKRAAVLSDSENEGDVVAHKRPKIVDSDNEEDENRLEGNEEIQANAERGSSDDEGVMNDDNKGLVLANKIKIQF